MRKNLIDRLGNTKIYCLNLKIIQIINLNLRGKHNPCKNCYKAHFDVVKVYFPRNIITIMFTSNRFMSSIYRVFNGVYHYVYIAEESKKICIVLCIYRSGRLVYHCVYR